MKNASSSKHALGMDIVGTLQPPAEMDNAKPSADICAQTRIISKSIMRELSSPNSNKFVINTRYCYKITIKMNEELYRMMVGRKNSIEDSMSVLY